MARLSPEQQKIVTDHLHFAECVANRYGCESDVAYVPLCQAVLTARAGKNSLRSYIFKCVRQACLKQGLKDIRFRFAGSMRNVPAPPNLEVLIRESLPDFLQEIALSRWVKKNPVRLVMEQTGFPQHKVYRLLAAAKRHILRNLMS